MTEIIGRPAYQQVADDIRSKISSGAYPVGSPVPSTQQLTEQYSASSTVVRAAINELRNEGVLMGQPGKGVYVVRLPSGPPATTADVLEAVLERLDTLEQRVASLEGSGK